MNTEKKRRLFRPPSGKLISLREMAIAWWPVFLLIAAGFVVAYQFVQPAPPASVVINTGAEDGAYYAFAERYREVLARNYIWLEIRPSSGSVENYKLLQDPESGVDIAFVQAGIGAAGEAPELTSLGSVYYEPLWVFHRVAGTVKRLTQLKGSRIAIGPEGSGTRRLAAALLGVNKMPVPQGALSNLTGQAAAKALQQGRIDAAIFVASPQSPVVNALLRDRTVRLMDFAQAEAYTRHFPYLSALVLPKGGIDLQRNIPPQDMQLLATTANLLAREDLHPAIVGLLAAAATEVHGPAGLFQRNGEFPSGKGADFPLNPNAERYYRSGPPFLQRYLPFWAAIFVDRIIILLVPVIALMIPLLRILPWLYNWRVSSRIYRHYGQLRFLEDEVIHNSAHDKVGDYLARLDQIESQVNRLPLPLAFNHQLYTLREHIDLVRERIGRLTGSKSGG